MEKKNINLLKESKGKSDNLSTYPISTLKEMINSRKKSDKREFVWYALFAILVSLLGQIVFGYIISKKIDMVFYLSNIVISGALVFCSSLISKMTTSI